MKTSDYKISGMTCSNCVISITKAVEKLENVEVVDVNLALNLMTISFQTPVDNNLILQTVKKTGYKARLIHNNQFETKMDKNMVFSITKVVMALMLTLPMWLAMILSISKVHNDFALFLHNPIFQLILTSIIQFILGVRFYKEFYNGIKSRQANMAFLIVVGTLSAYGLSIYNATVNNWQATMEGEVLYFELSATIVAFVLLGKLLEEGAKTRTSSALNQLVNLLPQKALLLVGDEVVETNLDYIKINDQIVVKTGSSIPFDGKIISGQGSIDESMLTGESRPIFKKVDDLVNAGTINLNGYLVIKVEKLVNQSVLYQVVEMVKTAQTKKTQIQKVVDRISGYFVPIIFTIALITLIGWTIYFQGWNQLSLLRAITVLVIACPCALGLATPTAILVGTSKAAKLGIIFKSADSLEKLAKTDFIIFDKTGTLTQGAISILELKLVSQKYPQDQIEQLIYNLEKQSEHPIGYGISKSLTDKFLNQVSWEFQDYQTLTSLGLQARWNEKQLYLGNNSLMNQNKIDLKEFASEISKWQDLGNTIIYLAIDNELIAYLALGDKVKPNGVDMIEKLNNIKIPSAMLTGDGRQTAQAIGKILKIPEIISEVKIFEKSLEVEKKQSLYKNVAMVGDGINDAVALNQADIGITFANATDIAISSSDVLILQDDVMNVFRSIIIARKTYKKIKTNLFWAFLYNVLAIPLAAFGLIFPELGALVMVLSSISVIINSLFLKIK
ncbi:cation-translocating P-type ATPase [Spiroplasma endosymbiont of Panorpa germanica]|uniref:heavy metal translocating P-type ATPase n=1 Tax=Spiroplasma endosymbiont of Panorpa germanica TaxID=3066314 RepID=UPI0030CED86F